MIKKLLVVGFCTSLVACGGPGSSDIEGALNAQLKESKSFQAMAGKDDGCPSYAEELSRASYTRQQSCRLWYSQVEDVDVDKCVEERNGNYSCKFSLVFASQRYGNFSTSIESTFAETASGWKEVQ
ncbi:hypothetical protein [Pseudoalteromonas sp. BDTF-M6]|uniref:hypothetical protein n=1 Tax=Pseudoalteromonas sp. BDTF-M6 TaxID=2796132 RepID=UPI001BAEE760|nr:hypothetical protein [Pseudoalteromonas sp. BDTF-M6]MBS3796356.1 hypothetical protein [Pseudoalteromonas sp. BDTF-M6]